VEWRGHFVRGRGDPLPLMEKLLSGGDIKVTKELGECLRGVPSWQVKWCSRERLCDWEAILLCGVLQQCELEVA
jgi:hypothetical protein